MRLHNAHGLAEDGLKAFLGLDQVIGGHHGDRCLRVHFPDDCATETDGVQRVSSLGLTQKLASGKVVEDEIAMPLSGTDEAPLRFHQTFQALKGQPQEAFPLYQRCKLLGKFCSAHGPQPGACSTGKNNGVPQSVVSFRKIRR